MSKLLRTTNLIGVGTLGLHFTDRVRRDCDVTGATPSLLTAGALELNRHTYTQRTQLGGGGVIDVSPPPGDIVNALGHAGSDDIALRNRDNWQHVARRINDGVVQAQQHIGLVDGQCAWVQGFKTGHGKPAEEMLADFKLRLPRNYTVAVSTLPDNADKRSELRVGHDRFLQFKEAGLVEATVLVDNRSPFARTFNLEIQDRFFARGVASLLGAQLSFAKNPSWAEMGRSLGKYGAHLGVAFASCGLVAGKEPKLWGLLRKGLALPGRGVGDTENVFIGAQEATRLALHDERHLAIEERVDHDKPFGLIYTVPLARSDRRWLDFANRLRSWLLNTYPYAVPVFCAAQGAADPRFQSAYWLQVTALFPIPDVPVPIQQILASPNPQRRQVLKLPRATANGTGPKGRPAVALVHQLPELRGDLS